MPSSYSALDRLELGQVSPNLSGADEAYRCWRNAVNFSDGAA